MNTLALYHVQPSLGIGAPLLITAVTETTPNQWAGEMHLLLEDAESTVLQIAVQISGNAQPADEADRTTVLQNELLSQAIQRLALFRQDRGHISAAHLSRTEVLETNRNVLVHFWMHSPSGDKLSSIRKQTMSPVLREELDLVASLPRFPPEARSAGRSPIH
jgi:hypothetical protein